MILILFHSLFYDYLMIVLFTVCLTFDINIYWCVYFPKIRYNEECLKY